MKVLVTGGAGYIGSVVADELLQAGHEVVVLDNLSHGHRHAVPKDAELIVADLADRDHLDQIFQSRAFDAVIHLAALIEAGESMKAPEQFFRNNTANALTLLEAMLAWFHQIHGLRFASLRYFNAAGASRPDKGEAHQPESHLVPRIIQVALGRAPHATIFGTDYPPPDGTCVRDYIHVSDLAHAHLLALEATGKNALAKERPLIYNLGNGQGFSVREVVEVVRKVTGHAIPIVESPRRPGDPAILIASSEKIRRELGWQPRFAGLEAIVDSAWQWHSSHPDGSRQ